MNRKKWIAPAVLVLALAGGAISGCITTDNGQGIEVIENMSEKQYNKWRLYLQLSAKIGANRALSEGVVTEEDLGLIAEAIRQAANDPVVPGASSILLPILEDFGLSQDEAGLILLIVEQELLSRGALEWVDPETGTIGFSPRTKELLNTIADAIDSAAVLSEEEIQTGAELGIK